MLLKQLNYFATVAELGSFTEAAYACLLYTSDAADDLLLV